MGTSFSVPLSATCNASTASVVESVLGIVRKCAYTRMIRV